MMYLIFAKLREEYVQEPADGFALPVSLTHELKLFFNSILPELVDMCAYTSLFR